MPRARARKIKTEEVQNRVFISYSRRDADFVKRLYASLAESGVNAWVDWEDIPPSAQWMEEIRRAIDASDAIAFVVSSRSLASQVCLDELDHAVTSAKRLIPIVIEEPAEQDVPQVLRALNWIFARCDDEYPGALAGFIEAVSTDLGKLRMHSRLLMRAREWSEHRRDPSYLLRGLDLRGAETWLAGLDARGPLPATLQSDYILESQGHEREEAERWKKLYQQSLARQLAAQSQLLVDQRGTALPLAAALAVEAADRSPSLETDQALRRVLRLMPARVRTTPLPRSITRAIADGADVMAIAFGSTLQVWPLDGPEPAAVINAEAPFSETGLSSSPLAISRDGGRVAGIVGGKTVRVWRTVDGSAIAEHKSETDALGLAFNADATKLAVTTEGRKTVLLEVATGAVTETVEHESAMPHLAFHPAGTELAVWGDLTAELWDISPVKRISSMPLSLSGGHRFEFRYSPAGQYLALIARSSYEINIF